MYSTGNSESPRTFLADLWRRITATRYTRALESELAQARAELERLRAENRALLNSLLATADTPAIPSISAGSPPPSHSAPTPGPGALAPAPAPDPPPKSPGTRVAGGGAPGAVRGLMTPTRRRSWHQITRMLEFESAKKPAAGE